ncbi:EAL domain-containing protein [Thiocystis violacea]|uniref:EAL domain-containing protein n=1 Tax=Thiocystis violacea TaxID=13725 RepID=UPI001905B9D7|nr:sensor domain-containing phosphodiesterase [Thiocystis violacea]MBK1719921.1 diguanylate phosphodiesterase [Thiocystis violacea]
MPTHIQKPTLLIISSENSEAERLMGVLREAGLADRSVSIPNAERLDKVVMERDCDMILCLGYDRDVDPNSVFAAHAKLKTDIPLILIADPETWEGDLAKARRARARGVAKRGDHEHLKLIIARESADLAGRREASDLTARLRNCEDSTLKLIEVASAGVAFVQDGLHVEVNPSYVRLFGYASTDDVLATPFLDLFPSEQHKSIRELLKTGDSSGPIGSSTIDVSGRRADSSVFRARLLASPSEFDGEPCVRMVFQPIEIPATREVSGVEPRKLARATGLDGLIAEIETHIGADRIVERPFAIFFIRIIKGGELLRDMGLSLGLELLDEFGSILSFVIDERGFLSRLSDEGFGLVVDGLDELGAKALAGELTEKARLPARAAGQDSTTPDCEIGYFLVHDRASAAEDIINAAYRLCIGHEYTDQDHSAGQQTPTSLAARVKQDDEDGDAAIARKIEYALRNNQLKLVYQPIISLMGDNQENYSVLLRLLDEEENLLEAKDFIGPAIRRGLIEEVDKWTIRAAIEVIGEQRRAGHNLSLFINLSEDTFRNPSIILWICDCLREFDVRGNWLTIQFQEELVVGNLASIGKLVETLKKIKCRVAINRFGVTDRPEMLLQGLSLDFVLMKPTFAQGLADDANKQQRLLQLATLAREFNVKSIVTGVEDARALTVLWTAGVDYVQGNFLQRPSPTLEVHA